MHASFTRTPAEAVGARIQELRERGGASRSALFRRSGVHPSNIARIEFGEANPSLDTLTRLASALGTSVADLVRDVGDVRDVRAVRDAGRTGNAPAAHDDRNRDAA